jgi:lipoprotein-anchoring transpeptidase ErfK/SrfK
LLIVAVVATVVCGLFAITQRGGGDDRVATAAAPDSTVADTVTAVSAPAAGAADPAGAQSTASAPAGATPTSVAGADAGVQDLDGSDLTKADSCLMTVASVRAGDTGHSIECLQQALIDAGYYHGTVTGSFDQATASAVEQMQTERDLFVDGIVGRETALSLGIWPDEQSLVVHTPKPPAGAKDLMGYPLSSVASAGDNAPPLPENSGTGRRLVYDRAGQRVWAVGDDGRIIRSWLVSGSKYSNEIPGTHQVYSRSEMSTAWNGRAWLPKMVRWLKTDIGAIGFHAIPIHVEDNTPYMTEAELGTRLSGGCQRQANLDAAFTWDFAQIGTKVVVI